MKNWNAKEQKRYDDLYRNKKHYGVSDFDEYTDVFPEVNNRKLKVLDLACGAAHLSKEYDDYTGIDISRVIISNNRKTKLGQYHIASRS